MNPLRVHTHARAPNWSRFGGDSGDGGDSTFAPRRRRRATTGVYALIDRGGIVRFVSAARDIKRRFGRHLTGADTDRARRATSIARRDWILEHIVDDRPPRLAVLEALPSESTTATLADAAAR